MFILTGVITEDTLAMVAEHVKNSVNEVSCKYAKETLNYVFGPGKSHEMFLEVSYTSQYHSRAVPRLSPLETTQKDLETCIYLTCSTYTKYLDVFHYFLCSVNISP